MVEFFTGKKSQGSFAREVDSGVAAYADSDGMDNADGEFTGGLYVGHKLKSNINDTTLLEERYTNNTTRQVSGFYSPLKRYDNNIEFEVTNWWFLYYTLGICATADNTPSTDLYTHVFNILDADSYLPSFVLEHIHNAATPEIRNYLGCVVKKLTLSANKGEAIKASLDYVAQSVKKDATKETVSNQTITPYLQTESSLVADWANSGAYTTGTQVPHVESWTLELDNNQYAEPTCSGGADTIAQPGSQNFIGTLTLTQRQFDDGYYDYFDGETVGAIQLYVLRTATDYLKLTFENCEVDSAPDPIDTTGGIKMQTVKLKLGSIDATTTNRQAVDDLTDDYYEVL